MYLICKLDDEAPARYDASPREVELEVLARLKWKTEPPTEPGLYWAKSKFGVSGIYLEHSNALGLYSGDYRIDEIKSDITHWLGPLPPPESPT